VRTSRTSSGGAGAVVWAYQVVMVKLLSGAGWINYIA